MITMSFKLNKEMNFFLSKDDIDFINSKTIFEHIQNDKFIELQNNPNIQDTSFNYSDYYDEIACLQDILSFGTKLLQTL